MTVSEKVAYLRGLCDGLKIDSESDEGKLFTAVIDVLGDIASDLEDIEENALDIGDELDAISDDLADVENYVFGEDEDEDDEDEDDDYEFDEDEFVYSVTCPSCNEEITVSEDILELGEIDCPNCGEKLEFDIEEDEENE
ncbi:MAG: CD1247 N-terminal domain-containing protein [Oscillospiraceae bacterium]